MSPETINLRVIDTWRKEWDRAHCPAFTCCLIFLHWADRDVACTQVDAIKMFGWMCVYHRWAGSGVTPAVHWFPTEQAPAWTSGDKLVHPILLFKKLRPDLLMEMQREAAFKQHNKLRFDQPLTACEHASSSTYQGFLSQHRTGIMNEGLCLVLNQFVLTANCWAVQITVCQVTPPFAASWGQKWQFYKKKNVKEQGN